MHPLEFLKFGHGPLWTPELAMALAILGGLVFLTVIAAFYLRLKKRKERFFFFSHMLANRDLSDYEIRCFFRYMMKKKIPLDLILESEAVAKEVLRHCNVEEEEGMKKLGFDTDALVKRFLQRQKELRKKWNAR